MTTAIKRRRGTTTQHSTFTGLEGEITIDTTKDTAVVHDGATAGGRPLLREDLANNTEVVTKTGTQTLTNKTLTSPVINTPTGITKSDISLGNVDNTSDATKNAATATLTNKTITLGANTITGTVAQFQAAVTDGDFATLAGTETFTNKAFNGTLGATTPSTAVVTSLTDSGLTSGRVTYASTGGLLADSANFLYNGTQLIVGTTVAISSGSLTSAASSATYSQYVAADTQSFAANVGGEIAFSGKYNTAGTYISYGAISGLKENATDANPAGYIKFQTRNSAGTVAERMRIDSAGNVGIGTSSPQSTLDLGSSTNGRSITWEGSAGGGGYGSIWTQYSAGGIWIGSGFKSSIASNTFISTISTASTYRSGISLDGAINNGIRFFTDAAATITKGSAYVPTERMRLDASGNLGLGVTPSAWGSNFKAMQIGAGVGTTAIIGRTAQNNSQFGNNFYFDGTNYVYVGTGYSSRYSQVSGNHEWHIAASGTAGNAITFTQAMTLDASGNLLVGKTALDDSTNGFVYRTTGYISVARNGGAPCYFNRTGTDGAVVEIANDSSTVGSISVSGSSTSYNTSSDYRLKEDIAPMTGALATIQALKPVTYIWKEDGSDGQGFIAHELAEVCPDAVQGKKDAVDAEGNPVYQGIDTSFLVATLTAAIQEQQAMIDELKAKVAALEAA
jgi:hypothetical protein